MYDNACLVLKTYILHPGSRSKWLTSRAIDSITCRLLPLVSADHSAAVLRDVAAYRPATPASRQDRATVKYLRTRIGDERKNAAATPQTKITKPISEA